MPSFRELLTATKSEIAEVTTAEAEELRADGAIVLDVREADEFEQGAIPGAVFIPRGHLEGQIENRIGDKDANPVLPVGATIGLVGGIVLVAWRRKQLNQS